jgi:hypothetical protein
MTLDCFCRECRVFQLLHPDAPAVPAAQQVVALMGASQPAAFPELQYKDGCDPFPRSTGTRIKT